MNIKEPRIKMNILERISLSNRANRSQSNLIEIHYISYAVCELETHSDMCFELMQIQFALKFSFHMI